MKHIVFGREFSKLEKDKFTTLRRGNHYKAGITYKIMHPNGDFMAELVKIEIVPLNEIDKDLLMEDTDAKTYNEAIGTLQKLYKYTLKEDQPMRILYLERRDDTWL